jgi:glycosyltransferase involved in cell wall biosynthesis
VLALARALRDLRPDVVQTNLYSRVNPYARCAALLAGVPVIVAAEAGPPARRVPLRRALEQALASRTRFLAASLATRRVIAWTQGVPDDSVAVLPYGVEVRSPPPDRSAARRALDVPPDARVLACLSRLERIKGVHHLLAALPAIRARVPGTLCLVAGEGRLGPQLRAQIESMALDHSVRFMGPLRDVHPVIAAADVMVGPALWEGFGLALLEAMAARRPVVATAVGGVPEVVVDGQTGLLVPPADPNALARASVRMLTDPHLRLRAAWAGRRRAQQLFDASSIARSHEDLYRRWLHEAS